MYEWREPSAHFFPVFDGGAGSDNDDEDDDDDDKGAIIQLSQ